MNRSDARPSRVEQTKVLHVAQPVDGGVAKVVQDLVADQSTRGWLPVVACPTPSRLAETVRAVGAEVYDWPATRSPGLTSLHEAVRLSRIVRTVRPDVVHLHSSKAGLVGRLALRRRVPTMFQPHLWSFQTIDGGGLPPLLWERFAVRWTDSFICVSEDEANAGRAAGVAGEFTVVPNGIDTEQLRPGDRHEARGELGLEPGLPTAVCLARLAPSKGQDLLLEAWPSVLAEVPNARLVFVGDGPMRDSLRADYPISGHDSISWVGSTVVPEPYLRASDVVVVPSRAEGMALVPLEAMACGRSIVAFEAGGIRQSVGDAGEVLPIGDVQGLARAVAKRLSDPDLAHEEGMRGRARAERLFDRRHASESIAAEVEKLIVSTAAM